MIYRILSLVSIFAATVFGAGNPGWLSSKICLTGPTIVDTSVKNDSAFSLATGTSIYQWMGGDTLWLKEGLGSVARLRVYRNGQLLLREQDFKIMVSDSALNFSSQVKTTDSICVEKFYSPLLPHPLFSIYRKSEIPIFEDSLIGLQSVTSGTSFSNFEDTTYSKYRLNYSGSKSMAVTMGSGGGLGLDAALFINLDGQVAEDVFVEGQLSDQNVPIQPDGNTTTLKEIDTKFIRVHGKRYSYTLGNYLLDFGKPNEDRYTAKVQGVNGFYSRGDFSLHGSWSVSDGQYQSDTLRGVDGKQRGYYLRSKDGRQFITVLAGTERIWRNGTALQRGIDYTIDYSEGRLDFLSSVQVTSENLYSAEYQYTEQDFQRSLLAGEVKDTAGIFTWSVRAISELENKDQPLSMVLDLTRLNRFKNAGDSVLFDTLGRRLRLPQSQSIGVSDLFLDLKNFHGKGSLLISKLDKNLYSEIDDEKNYGYSTRYLGTNTLGAPLDKGGWGQADIIFDHEYRQKNFEAFKQLIEPRGFLETWNLNSKVAERGFSANRIRWEERPFSRLIFKTELGLANASSAADTSRPNSFDGSQSRRGGVSVHVGSEKTFLEVASEAKLAKSPDRLDNYRQAGKVIWSAGGITPSASLVRNEWQAENYLGLLSRSIKTEPEFLVSTEPIFGKVALTSGLNLLSQRTNFNGSIIALEDSVKDFGLSQKMELFGTGPWNSDLFYSFHHHQLWQLDGLSNYAPIPEQNNFNLLEWNNHLANRRHGYNLASSYRISQTAEQPLVNDYRFTPGRGNFTYDSLARSYNQDDLRGDYILVGLKRDTTLGTRPYQDLAFTTNFNLVPAKFPFAVSGVLADIEFALDLALDHQDTTGELGLLPLFGDIQIKAARSGRSRYSPSIHWKGPDTKRTANLNVDRSFTLANGIYAYEEKLWNQKCDFRHEINENWEYGLEQGYENRFRIGRTGSSSSTSENQNYSYGSRLLRRLPQAFSLEGRGQYLTVSGSSSSGKTELQGIKPGLKLEKSSIYNGRVFLDYGLIYFWGNGDGSYYTTGEFATGLTHRIEANANFQVGQNMFLNFDYVIRIEPVDNNLIQKLTAEARAVF